MSHAEFGGNMLMPRKILIVEDCGDLLDLLGEALALLGWETILAESGGEAMNQLGHDFPSIILLDISTPVMAGIKLAASVKAHPLYKNIPILAASASSSGLTRERCLALGCDDFIAKPFALPELEAHLANLMSAERQKAIRATGSINLATNRGHGRSRSASHRKVA
jgi:CheY-like chemotaxis protein